MNGHFEIDNAAYPIGYLRAGDDHKVFDMRSLKPLHSQPITKDDAVRIAAEVNAAIRSREVAFDDGVQSVTALVAEKVADL